MRRDRSTCNACTHDREIKFRHGKSIADIDCRRALEFMLDAVGAKRAFTCPIILHFTNPSLDLSPRALAALPRSSACRMCTCRRGQDIDIGVVGVPWDGGTTNRPGPRHGPRQMRDQSAMVRRMHQTSHIVPYDLANVADLGDASVNPANVDDALMRVENHFNSWWPRVFAHWRRAVITCVRCPILRALGAKEACRHDPF